MGGDCRGQKNGRRKRERELVEEVHDANQPSGTFYSKILRHLPLGRKYLPAWVNSITLICLHQEIGKEKECHRKDIKRKTGKVIEINPFTAS